jgi:hypothetical protein
MVKTSFKPNEYRKDVYMHDSEIVILDVLNTILRKLNKMETILMATYADVKAAVTAEEGIEASIIALTNALAANAADPATLDALVAQINADAAAMAAAVTANTPGASGATGATGA